MVDTLSSGPISTLWIWAEVVGWGSACASCGSCGRSGQQERKQRGNQRARMTYHYLSSFYDQLRRALCGGFKLARSSALTQPGDPTGKRILARLAISRAVLMSPRM